MIIIEGLDATGKSTIAEAIHRLTKWPIQVSEGPEKFPGEIIQRCHRYFTLSDLIIFDRHPIISQSIYGPLANKTLIPPYLVMALRERDPLIIEASPENILHHQEKAHDTPAHLEIVYKKRNELKAAYAEFLQKNFPRRLVYQLQFQEVIINAAVAYARRREENVSNR